MYIEATLERVGRVRRSELANVLIGKDESISSNLFIRRFDPKHKSRAIKFFQLISVSRHLPSVARRKQSGKCKIENRKWKVENRKWRRG